MFSPQKPKHVANNKNNMNVFATEDLHFLLQNNINLTFTPIFVDISGQ